MNLLLVQFLIVSILPLSLLGMGVYTWQRPATRPMLRGWWILTTLIAAAWMTRLLTPYLGREIDQVVSYYWRVASNYPLSLLGTLFLITTTIYLNRPFQHHRWLYLIGPVFLLFAFALDPAIWPYEIPTRSISGLRLRHFDLWAVLWIISYATPSIVAWILTEEALRQVPPSLYQNQVSYWFLCITTGLIGGLMGLFRDSLGGQQFGAIALIIAAFIGTIAVTHSDPPNVWAALRLIGIRLLQLVIIFGLTVGGLILIGTLIQSSPDPTTTLIAFSAILALIIVVINAALVRLDNHVRQPQSDLESDHLQELIETLGSVMDPNHLADTFLEIIRQKLHPERMWLLLTEEAPAGGLILRPLGSRPQVAAAAISGSSPLANHLRQQKTPLTQEDIDYLPGFNDIPDSERATLANWKCALFVPIHHGSRLVGLLALRSKRSAESYQAADFTYLREVTKPFANLLVQARNVQSFRKISDNVFDRNLSLAQEGRRLKELVQLYEQFTELLSPEMRKPFTQLAVEIQQLETALERANAAEPQRTVTGEVTSFAPPPLIDETQLVRIRQQVDESQAMIDNLIAIASHLEKQSKFEFTLVHIDAVLRTVAFNLESMADARRIDIELEMRGRLLPVWGDEHRLTEAFQQVLHNAIKFNRLGGIVQINCQTVRSELRVQITDYGVGIPEARLDQLWTGLTKHFSTGPKGSRRRTRIGLPLVRFIVQSHGGRVEASSTYGKGSTFTIYLPAYLETEEE